MGRISDREILREQAILGLEDPFYLSTEILQLSDHQPRTPEELNPIYEYMHQPRPEALPKYQKWLRFWSSPRFTAKTYITLVYMLGKILRDPNIAIIIMCEQKSMAIDSVKLLQEWLMLPKIIQLYGKFEKYGEWGTGEFTIAQRTKARRDPTVRALGLDVPFQGKRADVIWWDDLIGEGNNTEEGILKVESRLSASMPLLRPGGEGIYTCTRWNAYDPSTDDHTFSGQPGILKLWRQGVWHAPPPRGYFGAYAQEGDEILFPKAKVGEPLFPGVLPEENIQQNRDTMTPEEFNSQILNNPLPSDTRFFEIENFQYFDPFDEYGEPHEQLVGAMPFMAVDPNQGKVAKKSGQKLDDIAMCVGFIKWQRDIAMGFIVEWKGGLWKPDRAQDEFFESLRVWRPRKIFIETNTAGDYFLDPLRKRAIELGIRYLPIEDFHSTGGGTSGSGGVKTARISTLQEPYAYRRIWHARNLKNCRGESQLLRWAPNAAGHDDWADVLSIWWTKATGKRYAPRDPKDSGVRRFNIMNRKPRYSYTGT